MSLEKLNTEVRQEQIAQAALDLVAIRGLKNLNVASVARRIGLVPSAIYRHFKSKDEVIDSVLTHIQEMLYNNVKAVCEETSDPLERLRRLLFRHIKVIRENLGIPRIIFSDDIYNGHPRRKNMVFKIISGYLHRVSEIIRQGQESGQIHPRIDPNTVSVMFLGLIQPAALLWHISSGRFDVTKHAERAWKIFRGEIMIP